MPWLVPACTWLVIPGLSTSGCSLGCDLKEGWIFLPSFDILLQGDGVACLAVMTGACMHMWLVIPGLSTSGCSLGCDLKEGWIFLPSFDILLQGGGVACLAVMSGICMPVAFPPVHSAYVCMVELGLGSRPQLLSRLQVHKTLLWINYSRFTGWG